MGSFFVVSPGKVIYIFFLSILIAMKFLGIGEVGKISQAGSSDSFIEHSSVLIFLGEGLFMLVFSISFYLSKRVG